MRLNIQKQQTAQMPDIRPLQYINFLAPSSGVEAAARGAAMAPDLSGLGESIANIVNANSDEAKEERAINKELRQADLEQKHEALADANFSRDLRKEIVENEVELKKEALKNAKLNNQKAERGLGVDAMELPTKAESNAIDLEKKKMDLEASKEEAARNKELRSFAEGSGEPKAEMVSPGVYRINKGKYAGMLYDLDTRKFSKPEQEKTIQETVELDDGKYRVTYDSKGNVLNKAKLGESSKGAAGQTNEGNSSDRDFTKALDAATAKQMVENEANINKRDGALNTLDALLNAGLNTGHVEGRLGRMNLYDSDYRAQREEFEGATKEIAKTFRVTGEGAMSNRDLQLLLETGPSIAKGEQANKNIISRLRAGAQAILERDEYIAEQRQLGVPLTQSKNKFAEYASAYPIFDRDDKGNVRILKRPSVSEWESNTTRTNGGASPQAASGKVAVISPSGKSGFIPAYQLEEALSKGYKESK